MSRLKVLFVDDEPRVLEGLRNSLRRHRHEWDMTFVESGQAALELLDAGPFDVMVTDMRMPGMDGAELLHRARERHPSTMRIVLSGEAERGATVKALAAAHQYLGKPCDNEVLRASITRVSTLAPLLGDPALRRVVGALDRLPTVPRTYAALAAALASPTASMADIAGVIATDPAMSIKILQVANSAYFGPSQAKATLEGAITYLGLDLVKALALTANIFAALEGQRLTGLSLERFQRAAILAARVAHRLPAEHKAREEAFTAALVEDVGQLVLALGVPERYPEVLWLARDSGVPLHQVEQETLGVAHPAVGAYLLGTWGLPVALVQLTARHHQAPVDGDPDLPLLAATHVATGLAGEALGGDAAVQCGPLEAAWVARLAPGADLAACRTVAQEELAGLD